MPSQKEKPFNKYRFLANIIFWITIVSMWVLTLSRRSDPWDKATTSHSSSSPELWMLSNIYIGDGFNPEMMTVDGKLIILGSDDLAQRNGIIAFDGYTGNIVWRLNYDGISIATVGSTVIVGGVTKVMALDSLNGQKLWSTFVPLNVDRIELKNNSLYVFGAATARYFVLDPANGNILSRLEGPSPFEQFPIIGNTLYRKTGEGDVVAIAQKNEQELWRNRTDAISNIVVTLSKVYALSKWGDLLQLNPLTGQSESFIQFTPAPFNLDDYVYYLAVDKDANLLFAYLGDSRQLFAFRLPQE